MIGEKIGKLEIIGRADRPIAAKTKGSYWLTKCECGVIKAIAQSCLVGDKPTKSCGCLKSPSLIGMRFGNGIVTSLIGSDNKGNKIWSLLCDCGNIYQTNSNSLQSKNTTSCGCIRSGRSSKNYTGHEGITGDYWYNVQRNAKTRGLDFTVTIEQAWEKFKAQNEKCALTLWPLELTDVGRKKRTQTASLDRIDSLFGYVEGNIQWLHIDINKMKTNFHQPRFIEMCCAVASRVEKC